MFANRLILAVTAALLSGLAVASAAVAADGETKTLTNNAYHATAHVVCALSAFRTCQLAFPPTTYTTTLIKAVSCFTTVTLGSVVSIALESSGSEDAFGITGSIAVVDSDQLGVSINASTYLFLNKGDMPEVNAVVSNGSFNNLLICTIAGEHS